MLKRSKRNVKVMLTDPPHITGHARKREGGKFTQAELRSALSEIHWQQKNSRHLLPGAKPLKHLLTFGSQGRNRTCMISSIVD